jgi:mono/diheme cytochrome c family protein
MKSKTSRVFGITLLMIVFVIGGVYLIQDSAKKPVAVFVPELSADARRGEVAFQSHCSACHGENAGGTDKGPPLVDQIYRRAHHSDVAFSRAVNLGVAQHHWLFGAMPPQPELDRVTVDQIIVYIRELQKANGIQ